MIRFIRLILLAGLIAGTLDATGAVVNYWAHGGQEPLIIFRYIASAVFGRAAFSPASTLYIWGIVFHYLIALGFTALFFIMYPRMPILSDNRWVGAVLYGIMVWVVMNLVVVPMTRVHPIPFTVSGALIGVGILILAIGLPVSLMANYYYNYSARIGA